MYKNEMNLAMLHNESSVDTVATLNNFGLGACGG